MSAYALKMLDRLRAAYPPELRIPPHARQAGQELVDAGLAEWLPAEKPRSYYRRLGAVGGVLS